MGVYLLAPMPENKEKKIDGIVFEASSSDQAIGRNIDALRQEISGINGKIVDNHQLEIFTPRSAVTANLNNAPVLNDLHQSEPIKKMTPKDSAFANNLQLTRNLKKAA